MWDTSRDNIEEFLLKANSFHPTIKFTAEISEIETIFLDTVVYKGDRFLKESILDLRTHFRPTRIFIRVTRQASRKALLRTNSSQPIFEENIRKFAVRLYQIQNVADT